LVVHWTAWLLKIGPIACPEMSVSNYQFILHHFSEEQRPFLTAVYVAQCICRTDLHILWNMRWQPMTGQGPRQCGWLKSRWPQGGGPAPCCTVHTVVLSGIRYRASSQLLQWPVPRVHSSIMDIDMAWLEKKMFGARVFMLMGVTLKCRLEVYHTCFWQYVWAVAYQWGWFGGFKLPLEIPKFWQSWPEFPIPWKLSVTT
jgi:hypothetical protein